MSQAQQNYYQPRTLQYFQPNDLSRPIIYPQLGMSPEYHNLVYKYITDFAGTEHPPHAKVEDFNQRDKTDKEPGKEEESTTTHKDGSVAGMGNPALKDYLVPSDFILLGKRPNSPFFGNFNNIKLRKMNFKENPAANPPLGGVMSNYVLLRNRPDYQSFIPFSAEEESSAPTPKEPPVSKRQIADSTDTDDTVVINAENPHSVKMNDDESRDQMTDENGEDDEDQPAVAQSKPAAIALAGPGGVAQASPVGTALVGPGGLAVAAPSGTAVAGPAGQGVITPTDDKTKLVQKKIKEVWN
ncbi:UNVERIFIED_CONTAM: hypothetical protein PYX00_008958 [Menopon gallinae]